MRTTTAILALLALGGLAMSDLKPAVERQLQEAEALWELGESLPPDTEHMPPPVDGAHYANEHGAAGFIAFTEDQFYIADPKPGRKTVEWEGWQIEDIFEPIFDPPVDERPTLALLGMPKKNGKSTAEAAIGCYRMCRHIFEPDAPDEEGYCLAIDKEQASWIIYRKIRLAIERNPRLSPLFKCTNDYIAAIDGRSILRPLPLDASIAGLNPSFVLADEIWGIIHEKQRRAWDEMTRVPTRRDPLTVVATYAGWEDIGLLWDMYQQGLAKREAIAKGEPDPFPRFYFLWLDGFEGNKASWVTEQYLDEQRTAPGMRAKTFDRYHRNQWTTGDDVFVEPHQLDPCITFSIVRGFPKAEELYVAIDVGPKHDATSVVAVSGRLVDETVRVRLVDHEIWVAEPGETLDLSCIQDWVDDIATDQNVREIHYDPYQMVRVAGELDAAGYDTAEYTQSVGRLCELHNCLADLIFERKLELYPDDDVRQHLLNARIKEHIQGWRLVKSTGRRKIDLAIALGMACVACVRATLEGGPSIDVIGGGDAKSRPLNSTDRLLAWMRGDYNYA